MTREEYNQNPNLCLCCQQPIYCKSNEKLSAIRQKKFCNRSCAARYNNLQRVQKVYYCSKCGKIIGQGYEKFGSRKLCDECNPNNISWDNITYGEAKEKRSYQVNSRIRDLARTKYFKTYPNCSCINCGYSKHVEIHHIKNISSFSNDTPITTINDLNNLIPLCPNCHWEADNGLLDITLLIRQDK